MKSQIDWIPLSLGAVRPTQGKTLAVMQVNGGSQSFNAVNQLRILGRWMRLLTIPNQSSTPKAFLEFDDNDRMKPSPNYDRMVDVMEELVKFTLLTRGRSDYLVERYSERKETGEALIRRVNQTARRAFGEPAGFVCMRVIPVAARVSAAVSRRPVGHICTTQLIDQKIHKNTDFG